MAMYSLTALLSFKENIIPPERFPQHHVLPWLFTFTLYLTFASSEITTHFYILFLSITEPVSQDFSALMYMFLYVALLTQVFVLKNFNTFFHGAYVIGKGI
jgi:hypothetical protein